jgi:hypothetical protein
VHTQQKSHFKNNEKMELSEEEGKGKRQLGYSILYKRRFGNM